MSITGNHSSLRILLVTLLIILFPNTNIVSQEKTNYNKFYSFPLSIGVDYAELTPFTDYGFDATLTEIVGNVRYPIPSIPQLQPIFQPFLR
ncbi:MAG: hypothetical protein U9N32_09555 [Spirochaetota bacterium]|nr:hypothetical protein [Spirochaetota bacterium]